MEVAGEPVAPEVAMRGRDSFCLGTLAGVLSMKLQEGGIWVSITRLEEPADARTREGGGSQNGGAIGTCSTCLSLSLSIALCLGTGRRCTSAR